MERLSDSSSGEPISRDRLFLNPWAIPSDTQSISATVIEVGDHEFMGTGSELNGSRSFGHPLESIVVDQELIVDIDARTVIRGDKERVLTGFRNDDVAGEAKGEIIRLFPLRHIHNDLRNDTGIGRFDGCQCLCRDVVRCGVEVINLDTGLLQSNSLRFGFECRW